MVKKEHVERINNNKLNCKIVKFQQSARHIIDSPAFPNCDKYLLEFHKIYINSTV